MYNFDSTLFFYLGQYDPGSYVSNNIQSLLDVYEKLCKCSLTLEKKHKLYSQQQPSAHKN